MQLDSGIATIFSGRNTAGKGEKPNIVYDKEVYKNYYGSMTIGVNRYYTAKGHNNQVDLLVRIGRNAGITTAYRCRIESFLSQEENGMYKILQVQHVTDEDGRPATDISLERIENVDEP